MEKNKGIKHFICEKVPVVGMLLAVFISLTVVVIPEFLKNRAFGGNETYQYLADIALSIIFIILFKLWFSPAYKGSFKPGVSGKEFLYVLIPVLVCLVVNVIILFAQGTLVFKPTVAVLVMSLDAGFFEETMFRVTTIPIALHFMRSEKKVTWAWLIPAVVFGVSHMMNVTAGAAVSVIIVQSIASVFFGIYMAALFMRTGSILAPIIAHAAWDYIAFACDGKLDDGIMVQPSVDLGLLAECSTNFVLGIVAFVMIYRNKEKILSIWDEKWSG